MAILTAQDINTSVPFSIKTNSEQERIKALFEVMKMEDKILHLFKLQYRWYEGEFDSTILATTKEKEEVEQDLREITSSIRIDRKKEEGAHDCLPEVIEE